jgi:superfamily II DNA/RNA helicase
MTDAFQLIREILQGRAAVPDASTAFPEACHRRLCQVLTQLAQEHNRPTFPAWQAGTSPAGTGDLANLIRHILRREQEKSGGAAPTLLVPKEQPWPAKQTWDQFGVDMLSDLSNHYLVRARPWSPEWLPEPAAEPLDRFLYAETARRFYGNPLPGDPFLDALPWTCYRSLGQREAVHAVLTAPAASTLLVSLPTGGGKSLCAHLPSLLHPNQLSVIVVPTTALALDQERVLEPLIGHPMAYHSGTSARVEERNSGIRERIRRGTQRIVFTSPESLLAPLAGPLYAAARQGQFRLLAIDEAHIVDQWGDDFRPEFQELAGLRRDLLRECGSNGFLTLLLSATVTEACLDTLETLYGHPGPFAVLSSMQLRPEPSYWFVPCQDETARDARVLEACRHLPRPLILYVTKIDEAYRWGNALRQAGFGRLAVVTGKTNTDERFEVVRKWQAQALDLVVANSAFGLGMDKDDVRAVIHACVPETIDRFYQEVGRGGRDGQSCLSLLLMTRDDLAVAADLNQKIIISIGKGYERWRRMFFDEARQDLSYGRHSVRIDVVPEYRFAETDIESTYNRAWNVRTLTLLDRCRVIELDAQPPPQRDHDAQGNEEELEEKFRLELERHRNRRVLRILDQRHLEFETVWQSVVERARQHTATLATRGLDLMKEAMSGTRCLAEILEEAYTVPDRGGDVPRRGILVCRSCGGCPACRRAGRPRYAGALPTPLPVWDGRQVKLAPELQRLMAEGNVLAIFDDHAVRAPGIDAQRRERLIQWFLVKGVSVIVAPKEVLERIRPAVKRVAGVTPFFYEAFDPFSMPRLACLIVQTDGPVAPIVLGAGNHFEAPRVLWLPSAARDPLKPHCRLRDTCNAPSYSVEELCARIGL